MVVQLGIGITRGDKGYMHPPNFRKYSHFEI